MNLLIVTQKMDRDDPILGFFHRWVEEFAKHCQQVHVICLYEGKHELPQNVSVHSLGKENRVSRVRYILRFYSFIWKLRKEYDAVFVHMNPEYVVLGGIFWRLLGKKIGLWYAHGTVSGRLRISLRLANIVFTSTKEGMAINSPKRIVLSQGIDCEHFARKPLGDMVSAVTVGRVSGSKDLGLLIDVIRLLHDDHITMTLHIYGTPLTNDDQVYREKLQEFVKTCKLENSVLFEGGVTQSDLPNKLAGATFFLNAGRTGSLDKAILEAAATGRIVLSSNPGAQTALASVDDVLTPVHDPRAFVDAIQQIILFPDSKRQHISERLSMMVRSDHSLEGLISKITERLETPVSDVHMIATANERT